jgi:hypothetical protein
MANGIQNDRRDANNRTFLTIAGIVVVALILGVMFLGDWNRPNGMNNISPTAGNVTNSNTASPASGTTQQ